MDGIAGIISTAWPLLVMSSLMWIPVGFYIALSYHRYRISTYQGVTSNSFFRTHFDKGLYGEYLTYRILEACPGYKRLLANVYIPKEDGSTTEVDVVMLSEAGIYVFESKNLSGWIYGDEKSKMWTQVLNKHKYLSWGKGPKQSLRFSKSGTPHMENLFSTHYVRVAETLTRMGVLLCCSNQNRQLQSRLLQHYGVLTVCLGAVTLLRKTRLISGFCRLVTLLQITS